MRHADADQLMKIWTGRDIAGLNAPLRLVNAKNDAYSRSQGIQAAACGCPGFPETCQLPSVEMKAGSLT